MSGLGQKVASGAIWVTCERFATQAVSFVVGVTVYFFLAARFKVAPFLEYVNVALSVLKTRPSFAASNWRR